MSRPFSLGLLLTVAVVAPFASLPVPFALAEEAADPRPLAARDTVFLEEMTWMEVRDALAAGKRTVIVSTGGIEQNGPYLATGKHNVILRATTERIARKLGNTLVAANVPFVPEGEIDPPSGHMKYPGTISVSQQTFIALLSDICASLRTHGFNQIILIGDSGGNQSGMKQTAALLNKQWNGERARVYFIPQYYDFPGVTRWLESQGIKQQAEGYHDDFAMTAMMMVVDPHSVRMNERIAVDRFRINGIELAPADETIAWGEKIIDFRADATVKAIQAALDKAGKEKPAVPSEAETSDSK